MNGRIAGAGAWIATVSVILFAACMLIPFDFGSYFVCMVLPIGYIMMCGGFYSESHEQRRAAAMVGMVFAAIYAALIFLVYFAQLTTVRLDALEGQAVRVLDFSRGGLLFNYDLLGYGMMALSTFFMGLSVQADSKADKWMKALMVLHGSFFFGCFIMPMTGVFVSLSDGRTSIGGTAALVAWCAYFLPIGLLAYKHFGRESGD